MNLNLEIWGAGTARTLRPIWMAEELGLKYKLFPIGPRTGETQTKEFTKLNTKQKIPLLKHDDFILSESVAICRYLRRISNSKNIFSPQDDKTMALEDEWCNFIYGDSPKVVESCRNYFEKYLAVIENILGNQDSLFGYDFGLADILLTTCLDWAEAYEFNLPLNVSRYHESTRNREAYKIAFDINYKTKI